VHLWLIRHAKSAWNQPGLADFDRPLNARGQRDGPRMQQWLSEQPDPPQWIWCSDAVRTQETAKFVCAAFSDATFVLDHRLYHAGPETILNLIHETPEQADTVAIIAHNPGITQVRNLLCPDTYLDNMPTFGVAHLHSECAPQNLKFGDAHQIALQTPKKLKS
jgi:phosphohistidine phosphatase